MNVCFKNCPEHKNNFFKPTFSIRWYEFDDSVVREILGRKLSAKTRKDLDEVSEKTKVRIRSCRRQVLTFFMNRGGYHNSKQNLNIGFFVFATFRFQLFGGFFLAYVYKIQFMIM